MIDAYMSKILFALGIILILGGIIGGFTIYDGDLVEEAKTSKEVFDELYDNEYAEASYHANQTLSNGMMLSVVLAVGGGIVSGIFFFALATIINLLRSQNESRAT
ncbi:hypothetical protein ABES25_04730 [Bacillus gobiensis]|uniref:hypothetical protein n=1 Tax=Bacillus gobiensis TaxID=1441095 RepID=UPI003D197FF0